MPAPSLPTGYRHWSDVLDRYHRDASSQAALKSYVISYLQYQGSHVVNGNASGKDAATSYTYTTDGTNVITTAIDLASTKAALQKRLASNPDD